MILNSAFLQQQKTDNDRCLGIYRQLKMILNFTVLQYQKTNWNKWIDFKTFTFEERIALGIVRTGAEAVGQVCRVDSLDGVVAAYQERTNVWKSEHV